jgi:hypothetical protein
MQYIKQVQSDVMGMHHQPHTRGNLYALRMRLDNFQTASFMKQVLVTAKEVLTSAIPAEF